MLRMIGIPSRVAVGFTAGTWKGGVWTVTDHQAHAWVEAWFAGHGWLAFDPTPGRGILSAVYTLASDSADAVAALGTGRFLDFNPQALTHAERRRPRDARRRPRRATARPWWLVALLGDSRSSPSPRSSGAKRASAPPAPPRREPRALAPACAPSSSPRSPTAVRPSIRTRRSASSGARRSVSLALPVDDAGATRSQSRASGHPSVLARRRSRRAGSCAASSRPRGAASGPAVRLRSALSLRSFRPGLTPSAR